MAAMRAAVGMVNTQPQTMLPAMPQRTARRRWTTPAPTIAPEIVCVLLTGMPNQVANRMLRAKPVSAAG